MVGVAMDVMAVAIHIKYALNLNSHLIPTCSPWDQGFGLEASREQKWKTWSWIMKSWSWSWTFGLGLSLGLGLEETVLQFSRLLLSFLTAVSKAHHGILWETTKAVCHSVAIVWENLRSVHIRFSWEGII